MAALVFCLCKLAAFTDDMVDRLGLFPTHSAQRRNFLPVKFSLNEICSQCLILCDCYHPVRFFLEISFPPASRIPSQGDLFLKSSVFLKIWPCRTFPLHSFNLSIIILLSECLRGLTNIVHAVFFVPDCYQQRFSDINTFPFYSVLMFNLG